MKIAPGSEAAAKAHVDAAAESRRYCVSDRCGWMGPASRAAWRNHRQVCPECGALVEGMDVPERRAA